VIRLEARVNLRADDLTEEIPRLRAPRGWKTGELNPREILPEVIASYASSLLAMGL